MDTLLGVLLSLFFGFIPMLFFSWLVYWTDRYEKEPKLLLGGVFIWGAIVAAGAAFIINTILGIGIYIFTESESFTDLTTGSLIAPIVEESLKGFAVLVVFLIFRHEFDTILDGIVYAAIAALGFAATENAFYIFSYGYLEGGLSGIFWLVFVRVILVGWQHPFYTAFIGIGLAISRLNRNVLVKSFAPILGWCMGIFAHSIHNTLASFLEGLGGLAVSTFLDWSGWLIMLLFIMWALYRERSWIVKHLPEEVTLGIITPEQYHIACSAWKQSYARFASLASGKFGATSRLYQKTAELAYKKQQLATLGEEGGNTETIERLRSEIAHLSPSVKV